METFYSSDIILDMQDSELLNLGFVPLFVKVIIFPCP